MLAIALTNTWLLVGLFALGWLRSPLVVLGVLIVLKAIAELFHALVNAQTGDWQRADDAV